ncbi:hypothetical protein KJ854_00710 [Patescibacteria group bacterium]|nr:hypothetical protein [Patescibacteria group bacterium]
MLKRFKRAFLLAASTSVIVMALVFAIVKAGSLTPPGPVGSTMRSLQEIYNSIAGDDVTFTGSGLNDMTFGGTFIGVASTHYRIQIDAAGATDTFKWSDDGGTTWVATAVAITGLAQTLNNGITITFGATTGHTLDARWDFYRQVADINGNIIEQLKYISGMTLQQIHNNSGATPTITDSSANAILTIRQTGAGSIFDLRNGTNSLFSVNNLGQISGASGQIKAAENNTFYTEGGHPIRAVGEEIFIASKSILGFDYPVQYSLAAKVRISRLVTLDANSFPAAMTGTTRYYKIGISYIISTSSTDTVWKFYNVTADPDQEDTIFTIAGSAVATDADLDSDKGTIYISSNLIDSDDDTSFIVNDEQWYLNLEVSGGGVVRIYSIDLMAYDVLQ